MSEAEPDSTRRRDLLEALRQTSQLHYHRLLIIVILIAGQGISSSIKDINVLLMVSMALTIVALGGQLWYYHDQIASIRLRLRPLLEGDDPTPDAKTLQELEWLSKQDPWLDRVSVWGLWLGAAFFLGGCIV